MEAWDVDATQNEYFVYFKDQKCISLTQSLRFDTLLSVEVGMDTGVQDGVALNEFQRTAICNCRLRHSNLCFLRHISLRFSLSNDQNNAFEIKYST